MRDELIHESCSQMCFKSAPFTEKKPRSTKGAKHKNINEDTERWLCLTVAPVLGFCPLLSFSFHPLGRSVIHISLPFPNQLLGVFHDSFKMIRGVSKLVWFNMQHRNIFQDNLQQEPKVTISLSCTFPCAFSFLDTVFGQNVITHHQSYLA